MRTAAVLATLMLLVMACGEAKQPCTTCPSVAGFYHAESPAVPSDKSSCGKLYMEIISSEISVRQEGSSLSTRYFFGLEGTLYEDFSVLFDPVDTTTNTGTAGTLTVSGSFSGEEGARVFKGTMTFVQKSDSCKISAPLIWTQEQPAP